MAEDGPPLALQVRRKDFVADDGSRIHVLDDVAFQLPRGSFTCLIGPSGCGKTTTMRILMGLDDAYEGWIDGAFRELRVAAAFQEPRLLPWRTLEQNVRLALPRDGEPADVARALSEVGLEGLGHRYPAQLSLGQARRAALARAFAVRPEILYLDEPFVSLDEATARRLRELTLELCRTRPVTVLMVTQRARGGAARRPDRAPDAAPGAGRGRGRARRAQTATHARDGAGNGG